MDGAEVKGGADIRFAIKDDNPGKTAAAGAVENRATNNLSFVLSQFGVPRGRLRWMAFACLSFWVGTLAGIAGFAAWLFTDISAGWVFALFSCSLLLIVYGGMLWGHTLHFHKTARHVYEYGVIVEERTRKATHDLAAEKQASHKRAANAEKRHNAQMAKVKAEKEQLRADMREEMEERDNEAVAKYNQLASEKEKLALTLSGTQETLAYYSDNDRLDVYAGEAAVRECGGIYVISNANEGRVKIGLTSDNMSRRLTELRATGFSAGIKKEDIKPEVLVPLDEGMYEVEQEIHRALADRRTAGEWFKMPPEEAVAVVLAHVRKKRMDNFKARTKLHIQKGDGK